MTNSTKDSSLEDLPILENNPTGNEDYGDAPDDGISGNIAGDYTTLAATGGANHTIDPNLTLGTLIDADDGNNQNNTATADNLDATENDEDGVTFPDGIIIQSDDSDRIFNATVNVNFPTTSEATVTDDFSSGNFVGGTGWTVEATRIGREIGFISEALFLGFAPPDLSDRVPSFSRAFDASAASGDGTLSFNYGLGDFSGTGTLDKNIEIVITNGLGESQTVLSVDETDFSNPSAFFANEFLSVTIPQNLLTSTSRITITTSGDFTNVGNGGAFYFDNFDLTFPTVPETTLVGWIDFDRSGTFDEDEASSLNSN